MAGGQGESDVGNKLTVNQTEYSTVNAVLELVKILYEYIKVIRFFWEISYEASLKLLELIDIFNSQVFKLILGKEAYNNRTLEKGINCWHLSLTTQCISFMIAELPFLKQ